MAFEDDLGWEYFGNDPANSPKMMEHMDWHNAAENANRTGNYGERFLVFHQQFIGKFDVFRQSKNLLPVSGWDPSTPIAPSLAHPHTLHAPRDTDNPFSINPNCKTPTWATVTGGSDHDPLYGHTSLLQFKSLDELGRAIDDGWHGTVHNTIGGDMATFDSPIDPVFWRWHKWIDGVRATWQAGVQRLAPIRIASLVKILFGVVNDGPGLVLGPNGQPIPIPGGPGDPIVGLLSLAVRDMLLGHLVGELAKTSANDAASRLMRELSGSLTSMQTEDR